MNKQTEFCDCEWERATNLWLFDTIRCNRYNHHFDFRNSVLLFSFHCFYVFDSLFPLGCSSLSSFASMPSEKIKIKCKHYKFYIYFTAFERQWQHRVMCSSFFFSVFTTMIVIWKLVEFFYFLIFNIYLVYIFIGSLCPEKSTVWQNFSTI